MIITPALNRIRSETYLRYGAAFGNGHLKNLGVYNRRNIAGTNTWSQHSWGNAFDIGGDTTLLDEVYIWLRNVRSAGSLPIGTILWRVRSHYDHIHVEATPKQTGTPPKVTATKVEETMNLSKETWQAAIDLGVIGGDPITGPDWYINGASQAQIDHGISELIRGLILRLDNAGVDPASVITTAVEAAIKELRKRLEA